MANPLFPLAALIAATTLAAVPTATAARASEGRPHAAAAMMAGERIVIGPDGADMREIVRHDDGMFYVHALINGTPVRFLVDTGATDIILTSADAARAGLAPASGRYGARIATAGGSVNMAWTKLAQVEVAGKTMTGMRAAIMRRGLGVSLLGQNLLSRFDRLTIEGDTLRMR